MLDTFDKVLPKDCEKFMVGGNHEARYEKFKVNYGEKKEIRKVRRLTSWHEEYRLKERKWKFCEYGQWFEFGKIIYTHGWASSGNHAQKHLGLFHKNIIYGHTHQFQVATGRGLDGLPVEAASIGTLSEFDLSYLVGKPPVNWVNMFCYIDTLPNKFFTPHYVHIINGKFIELGRQFPK